MFKVVARVGFESGRDEYLTESGDDSGQLDDAQVCETRSEDWAIGPVQTTHKAPMTSGEALALAVTLAMREGDYDRAADLVQLARAAR